MSKLVQIDQSTYHVRIFNNDFILLENNQTELNNHSVGEAILAAQFTWCEEVIATEDEICIKLTGDYEEEFLTQLGELELTHLGKRKSFIIPVYFGDENDWPEVIDYSGLNKSTFISHIIDVEYTVAMFGFLPGFTYFNGLPDSLHIPRKSTPSGLVPGNSIAIGGKYLGFYSLPSPGGWHVIGQCPFNLFDANKLPPVVIPRNCSIRLTIIDRDIYHSLISQQTNLIEYNAGD